MNDSETVTMQRNSKTVTVKQKQCKETAKNTALRKRQKEAPKHEAPLPGADK
jgi:hypothetical protein